MKMFEKFLLDADSVKQQTINCFKRFGLALQIVMIGLMTIGSAHAQSGSTKDDFREDRDDVVKVKVFQAAGPNGSSIQSTVDQFRIALGDNNGVTPPTQPLTTGRREINWDGGSPTVTATTITPQLTDNFLNGRGARFTTTGSGFVQAPPSGLADVFGNSTYATIFKAFSLSRLFSPIGSNVTDTLFFVPGHSDEQPATTRGFGVVFSDVDLPDGSGPGEKHGNRQASALIEYFNAAGELLLSSFAPASPGDGNLSFFGVVFEDARIARVRITAGAIPGSDDTRKVDVVMMDDFIFGEPQRIVH